MTDCTPETPEWCEAPTTTTTTTTVPALPTTHDGCCVTTEIVPPVAMTSTTTAVPVTPNTELAYTGSGTDVVGGLALIMLIMGVVCVRLAHSLRPA